MVSVKSFATDDAKAIWRQKLIEFITRNFSSGKLRSARVLCLPGKEMREVFEVYDALGIKRKNIVGVEQFKGEYDQLCALNAQQSEQINPVNMGLEEYFTTQRVNPFDIISLDYCGYHNDEKDNTIAQIALRNWAKRSVIIATNYLMARENDQVKSDYRKTGHYRNNQERLSWSNAETFVKWMTENREEEDLEGKLEDLRDTVVQGTPLKHFMHGTGFWNQKFFREWLRMMPERVRDYAKQVFTEMPNVPMVDRIMWAKLILNDLSPEAESAAIYLLERGSKLRSPADHAHYKYISDSNQPMISDFYLFVDDRFIPPKNTRRSISYQFRGGLLNIDIKHSKRFRKLVKAIDAYQRRRADIIGEYTEGIPYKRELLGRASRKRSRNTTTPITEEDKEIMVELIQEGYSSKDIVGLFDNYTPMQVAGVKAAISRKKNQQ